MKTISLTISDEWSGKQIKSIMKNKLGFSSALITRQKRYDDGIMLDGVKVNVTERVKTGDTLTLNLRDESSKNIVPTDMPLDILFEDEDLIALNKPRNMPTHPSIRHFDDTLANGLMYYFKDTEFTFRVITRLDRDTSGIVLVAKNPLSAHRLCEKMRDGKITKEYYAICHGTPKEKAGRIDAPIKRCNDSIITRCVAADGKEAVTDYRLEKGKDSLSLIHLMPLTGRTHQIRVHLAHIGHPIYGDDMYGSPIKDGRTLLHCGKITFPHPSTNETISIIAPLPDDMVI